MDGAGERETPFSKRLNQAASFFGRHVFAFGAAAVLAIAVAAVWITNQQGPALQMLTDPFLQLPKSNSVNVVWFTDAPGTRHGVVYGPGLTARAEARSRRLSRVYDGLTEGYPEREIWRHEAVVDGLEPGERVDYAAVSEYGENEQVQSSVFSLAPLPAPGAPVKILLTSDHQLKAMTPANMQKIVETAGRVDAVFFAGDLVNIPDQAEEWFDHPSGLGFFAAIQGRTRVFNPSHAYEGGAILQYAPIFPAIGNHEVMGAFDGRIAGFSTARPRWFAEWLHDREAGRSGEATTDAARDDWVRDRSFNAITYKEIFSLPGNEEYYSQRFGNVALISLFATRPWRRPAIDPERAGKYHETPETFATPENWRFGDFPFERFDRGSDQYGWLRRALASPDVASADYRLVMSHQVSRGLGENIVPLLADPIMTIAYKTGDGEDRTQFFQLPPDVLTWENEILPLLERATEVRYDYPRSADHWRSAIEPLLEASNVDLVFHGHSHLWYRMRTKGGMHYLESSNVGNTYGGYVRGYKGRALMPPDDGRFYDRSNYSSFGDPYDGTVSDPNIFAPMTANGRDLPVVDSNSLTVFSIFDSGRGVIESFVFDTSKPDSEVHMFDAFQIGNGAS